MSELPWIAHTEMEPGRAYTASANYVPLTRLTSTVSFFHGVTAVREQLVSAEGLIGYGLRKAAIAGILDRFGMDGSVIANRVHPYSAARSPHAFIRTLMRPSPKRGQGGLPRGQVGAGM